LDVITSRALRIEGDGPALEALLHLPDGAPPFPGIVLCHPHPLYGGDMYNNVTGAIVRAATGVGAAALRFNFRGVGESEGRYAGGEGEQDDVRAALGSLRAQPEVDPERVALGGYSFGAVMAFRVAAAGDQLASLLGVSLPTPLGSLAEMRASEPILLTSGDRDDYSDVGVLAEFKASLGEQAELVAVPGADHFWWGSADRLIEITGGFLRRTLLT
jgi:alpha/beta superfamily hydrolase